MSAGHGCCDYGFRSRAGERLFALLFVVASVLTLGLNHILDPDLFWHLRGGMDILRAGKIVLPDSWNYLFQGNVWVNQQWLTEILFFKSYEMGGFWGLMLFRGLVSACVICLILATFKGFHPSVRYTCAAVVVACNWKHFLFRTHIMSFLCMAALLYLMEVVPSKRRLPLIALLFALWANLHTVFGLGLMVLGLYTGARWLQALAKRTKPEKVSSGALESLKIDVWEWVSIPAACAATLLNPFGWGVWKTVFTTFGRQESFLIAEWWPIWMHSPVQLLGFYFLAGGLVLLVFAFPRKVHLPSLAASVLLAALTVKSARFSSDFVLPSLPLLAGLLDALISKVSMKIDARRLSLAIPAITGMLLCASVLSVSYSLANPITVPSTLKRVHYPVKAVNWMKLKGLSGKIFTEYGWGGYLEWAMPESRTNIDGRTSVLLFPEGHTQKWRDAIDLFPGWKEYLEQGNPDFVLISKDDVLSGQLASEAGWRTLYQDEMSILFGRAGGGTGA